MTNEDKLREIFPKTIFLQHKESDKITALVCSDEWLNAEYQEPRWIPVSERLPEKEEYVLCWLRYGDYMIAKWKYEEWTSEDKVIWVDGNPGTGTFDVIAWMPLPEPFEPQESEDKYGNNTK